MPLTVVTSAVAGGLCATEKGCSRDVQGLWVVGKAVVVVGLAATVTIRDVARVAVVTGAGGRVVTLGVGGGCGVAALVVVSFL